MEFKGAVLRSGGMKRYFRSMAPDEFQKAFDDLLVRDPFERRFLYVSILCQAWAEIAPDLAWAQALRTTGPLRDELLAGIIRTWTDRDVAGARAAANRLEGKEKETALAEVKRFETAAARRAAPPTVPASTISNRDLFWKNVVIQSDGSTFQNPQALKAFERWVHEDPAGAAKEIKNSTFADSTSMLQAIYDAWKEKDLAAANEFVKGLKDYQQDSLLRSRIEKMAESDLAGARALAETIQNPKTRADLQETISGIYVGKNPKAAKDMLLSTTEEARAAKYPKSLLVAWMREEPEAAVAWLAQDAAYQKLFAEHKEPYFLPVGAVLPWLQRDPTAAANFLAGMHPNELPNYMEGIGKEWVNRDPRAACDWAKSLAPDHPAHAEALKQFTYLWAEHDVKASTQYLGSLPPGPGKTGAAEGFVFSVFDEDPNAALAWARVIPVESKRLDVLGRAWSQWRRKNSRAATFWLENNKDLTSAEREELQNR